MSNPFAFSDRQATDLLSGSVSFNPRDMPLGQRYVFLERVAGVLEPSLPHMVGLCDPRKSQHLAKLHGDASPRQEFEYSAEQPFPDGRMLRIARIGERLIQNEPVLKVLVLLTGGDWGQVSFIGLKQPGWSILVEYKKLRGSDIEDILDANPELLFMIRASIRSHFEETIGELHEELRSRERERTQFEIATALLAESP